MIEISSTESLFILTTGCRWQTCNQTNTAQESTAHLRFQELQQKGIWKKTSISKLIKLAGTSKVRGLPFWQKINAIDSSSIAAKKGAMR